MKISDLKKYNPLTFIRRRVAKPIPMTDEAKERLSAAVKKAEQEGGMPTITFTEDGKIIYTKPKS